MAKVFLDWEGGRLRDPAWQGIDYLTVRFDDPAYAAVVTAHLNRPAAGLMPDDVTVSGGRRLVDLRYEVELNAADDFFRVNFLSRGDRSNYTVGLRHGGDHPLHPFFAQAEFNFYIDCESGDCRPGGGAAPEPPRKPPALDLLTKDYRGFLQVLSDWVRVTNSHWADLSPASLERVLLELLCHHADLLSYYQDRVANEGFLETARQRYSLRQHGLLLGYRSFDGLAARTVLAFHVTSAGFVPAGLRVRMRQTTDEAPIVFTVAGRVRAVPENNWDQLKVAAWPGAVGARLRPGTTELLLWGQAARLDAGDRLALVQGRYAQVVTLTDVTDVTLPGWTESPADPAHIGPRPLKRLRWQEPTAQELRPWDPAAPFQLFANLADAVHGEPRTAWVRPPHPPSREQAVIQLSRRNSIVVPQPHSGAPAYQLRALQVPEGPVLFDRGPDGTPAPALRVAVDDEPWEAVETLQGSRSFDGHYVATSDEAGLIRLQFGDGVNGRPIAIDPTGGLPAIPLRLDYRVGDPLAGNCARDTLTEVVPPAAGTTERDEFDALGAVQVTNVVEGRGGQRPESLDALRESIPASLRHGTPQRAVALADYAAAAKQADPRRVARAAAKARGGPFNTVLVLVDPEGQGDLGEDLRDAVWRHLDRLRMAGREHFVVGPRYVPLEVELVICVEPGFLHHEVRDRVYAALRPGSADQPGYFHPDRLSFGEDVELGDLLAFVQGVPGVRSVKALIFHRLGIPGEADVVDRVVLGPTEVARMDGDDNFRENGVLQVRAVGLDVVDESLFATDGPFVPEGPP
jgi:hypothetical protein